MRALILPQTQKKTGIYLKYCVFKGQGICSCLVRESQGIQYTNFCMNTEILDTFFLFYLLLKTISTLIYFHGLFFAIASSYLIVKRKRAFYFLVFLQCGSFLSRGASKLARLASLIKDRNDGSQSVSAKANAGGNFVFSSVTAEEAAAQRETEEKGRKRTASGAPDDNAKSAWKKPKLAPKHQTQSNLSLNSSIFKHL